MHAECNIVSVNPSVCPSYCGIVSSYHQTFPPSDRDMTLVIWMLLPLQNSSGDSFSRALYTWEGGICNFQPKSSFVSETERDRPIVTMDY